MTKPPSVAAWLGALDAGPRAAVDALRDIVAEAAPHLTEEIKWNAPSYRDAENHKVTLGLDRKGGVRIVLHRGATARDLPAAPFADPARLGAWPTPDRGVISLADVGAIADRRANLVDIVRRWAAHG